MKYCPECGAKTTKENQRYCSECGSVLASGKDEGKNKKDLRKIILVAIAIIVIAALIWLALPKAQDYVRSEVVEGKRDCGSDLRCFADLMKICAPTSAETIQAIGSDNVTALLEVKGLKDGKCIVYLRIESGTGLLSLLSGKDATCTVASPEVSQITKENCQGALVDYAGLSEDYLRQLVNESLSTGHLR